MRHTTRTRSLLAALIAALTPAAHNYYCSICKVYYDPSDPMASRPHNNHY